MKLYHINPNSHGQQYFIMATCKQQALTAIKQYIKENAGDEWELEQYNLYWDNATVDSLPKNYSIDEYEPYEIIESEIA